MEKLQLDFPIPQYLEKDIDAYIDAINRNDLAWDCYYDEVLSSLRMAEHLLTDEQLQMIKEWYL